LVVVLLCTGPSGLWAAGQAGEVDATVEDIPRGPVPETAGKMKLSLREGLELEGTPVEVEALKVNSLFGEASIPLHTIAGIRFAQAAGEQTTIVLQNGDVLTGEVGLQEIKFIADWGEAKVAISHLTSIVFREDLAWTGVSTPSGQRWRLTRIQPSSSSSTAGTVPAGSNTPVRVFRSN
jgi:hypothetical protein